MIDMAKRGRAAQRRRKRAADKEEQQAKTVLAKKLRELVKQYGPLKPEQGDECKICYAPFSAEITSCGNAFKDPNRHIYNSNMRFPVRDWKVRGCDCPDAKICIQCVQKEAFRSAFRCCTNPVCQKVAMKCPWCREDVGIGDCFYSWVERHGGEDAVHRARLT